MFAPSPQFDIYDTSLQGPKVIQRNPVSDSRGFLERLFCFQDLSTLVNGRKIVAINHTLTVGRGTIRGLHFQCPPHAEAKFVQCLQGEVFDIAVDVRHNSPTFLQWHAEVLSAKNHKTFFIPEGFAHGFQSLSLRCEMLYFHTALYCAKSEGGLNVKDNRLAIQWPLPVIGLSARDFSLPMSAHFEGVIL